MIVPVKWRNAVGNNRSAVTSRGFYILLHSIFSDNTDFLVQYNAFALNEYVQYKFVAASVLDRLSFCEMTFEQQFTVLVVRNRFSIDMRQFNKSSLKILYRDGLKVIRDARQSFKKVPEYHKTNLFCQTAVYLKK